MCHAVSSAFARGIASIFLSHDLCYRRMTLRRDFAEGVVDEVVDHGGHVAARIILGNAPDRVQVVR